LFKKFTPPYQAGDDSERERERERREARDLKLNYGVFGSLAKPNRSKNKIFLHSFQASKEN
jgi:hypothetical protein